MKDRMYWHRRWKAAEAVNALIDSIAILECDDEHDACMDCPCQDILAKDRNGEDIVNPVCYHSCPMHWTRVDTKELRSKWADWKEEKEEKS